MKYKYIAMVEETAQNRREQWACGRRPNSLTASGRWTDARLYDRKQDAQAQANEMAYNFAEAAKRMNTGATVKPFVRSIVWDNCAKELYGRN